ncbi:MAG TPA: V-type ATP synthase subunit K [Chloroflexi bacterium]|nr:V-type ATP synthase subunit K [Chloroflexota bacterium]
MALALLGLGSVWFFAPQAVQAAGLAQAVSVKDPMAYVGAGIAVGVGALGAGYAVGAVGAAAVGVIAERPDMFGRALLFVGLAEGVAIYGLLIAFIILR